jgi:hypothetical protein
MTSRLLGSFEVYCCTREQIRWYEVAIHEAFVIASAISPYTRPVVEQVDERSNDQSQEPNLAGIFSSDGASISYS